MKKLGLICSFIIFTHALFALSVTPNPFSLTPGTTTTVTFTFDCDFDGNVVPSTTASGVTFGGLIPIPPNMVAQVNGGVAMFQVTLAAGASPDFSILFSVLSVSSDPSDCVDVSDTASASFGVFPPNNDCVNAITLEIAMDMCIPMAYSTTNATYSGSAPTCGGADLDDLFYKFTANDDEITMVIPSIPALFLGYYGLYDGCPGAGGSQVGCKSMLVSSGGIEVFSGLNVGTEYFLQILFFDNISGTDQELCLWSEAATVPVTWLKPLTVRSVDKKAEITFSTAQQTNNSHFDIEHSRDGQSFNSIGRLEGEGNESIESDYAYIHNTPAEGLNYYRVKQVDFDGKYSYSVIASLVCSEGKVRAYPNPVDDILTISSSSEGSLTIFSQVWQEVGTYPVVEGKTEVDMSQLGSGIYFLKYSDGTIERILKN